MLEDTKGEVRPGLGGSAERVLVVDDEVAIGMLVRRALERAGMSVEVAHNGREALELFGVRRYDVVLCDLRLPDVSGQELHAHIQRAAPDTARRMVFLTGDATSPEAVQFLARSGCRYISKPFDLRGLVGVVREVASRES
ncbi:MAG: hypothetical protein RLZZ387_4959 [Chloroflexota bacterium]